MKSRLTQLGFLVLVLAGAFSPDVRGMTRIVVASLLLYALVPSQKARGRLCLAAAATQFIDLLCHHPDIDNHRFLMFATTLLIGLAHGSPHPRLVVRRGSRLLIAFVFLAAASQKVYQRDFRDGSALIHFSRTDDRFASLSRWIMGRRIPDLELSKVKEVLDKTRPDWPQGIRRVPMPAPPVPHPIARARLFAWMVILGEAAVGLAYLAASQGGAGSFAGWVLLAFCGVTYPFLPIRGFGAYLLFLGLAGAVRPRDRKAMMVGFIAMILLPGFFR